MMLGKCCTPYASSLENSPVSRGLEKVSFHSNLKEIQCQRMFKLMAESKEELKSLLMKVKEESEKAHLKLNIQKTKIMASGPITSWQTDGETMEIVTGFILGGSKITAKRKNHCRWWLRPWNYFLLGSKAMTNLDNILKSKVITMPTKICIA